MAKYLKKYNKETHKWEIVSEAVVDVIQQVDLSGFPIDDESIIVTNPYHCDPSGDTTLYDALSNIGDDISKLQRNVSWLAEHGGGGGGGGGGTSGYGIYLIEPILENNAVFISGTSLNVTFMITGGTDNEQCQYRYSFDGNTTSYAVCTNNTEITFKINDIHSVTTQTTSHTLIISALNGLGVSIPSVSFKIYESSLTLSLNKTENQIQNNEVLMSLDDQNGNVFMDIKNGLGGSTTTVEFSCNNEKSSVIYTNTSTKVQAVPIPIWEVINKSSIVANELYTIKVKAEARLDTIVTKTDEIAFNVRITNPNVMAIYFDGLTYKSDVETGRTDPSEFEQNDRLRFSFKVNLPNSIINKNIYYAVRLTSPDHRETFITGSTFSDEKTLVQSQAQGKANINITIQYPLNLFQPSENWIVDVKAWDINVTTNAIQSGIFNIIVANNEIFPRQYQKRYVSGNLSADTCLFAWSYNTPMIENRWDSTLSYVTSDNTEVVTKGYIYPYNTNGTNSGFITETSVPHLRLQNEAYAIAELSGYTDEEYPYTGYTTELGKMITSNSGFTISITFKCDEHVDTDKVIFFYGQNDESKTLLNGIKITLDNVYWLMYNEENKNYTLKAFVRQNSKNTVDFVYDGVMTAYIYVNGIINAAYNIGKLDSSKLFGDKAYFGCEIYPNGTMGKYSDVSIYEFAIYTKMPNPLQLVVNGKNARINGQPSDEAVIKDYKEWKKRNLIYSEDTDTKKALSYLISNDTYNYDITKYEELKANSPIPIIRINANDTNFTESYFHNPNHPKSVTAETHQCEIEYFDPIRKPSETIIFKALISLQGTSTLNYYIKNLEMKINEICSYDSTKYKLFQPREDWFPEREFTLKADIVDSAHANNATIGYWINHECDLMEENPPQVIFNDPGPDPNNPYPYKPKEKVTYGGETIKHIDAEGNEIDYDEKITIKHNLEGFPFILLIKFADKTAYDLIGVYSFNLGRFSHYNLGLSFLKAFSRRDISAPGKSVDCPAIVDYYEEYERTETFGPQSTGIKLSEIFSYEFGADADDNNDDHQTWTQDDLTILKHYGDFNFNGENVGADAPQSAWEALQRLFYVTATMGTASDSLTSRKLTGKDQYFYQSGAFIKKEGVPRYEVIDQYMSIFNNYISVKNAVAYFIVACAFGMIDSLGKNLTLRTWNANRNTTTKWWTCFYDMDTALGLSNEGDENIPQNAFIDQFSNVLKNNLTELSVSYHDKGENGYNAYYSKLWAIFRDSAFLYECTDAVRYETAWISLRHTGGKLDRYSNFTDLMEEHIGSCGELIYDYDYNSKYILDTSNLSMLHGLRIEYVRDWLKKRFYFLDGVFEDSVAAGGTTFTDSPFYSNAFNVTSDGHFNQSIDYIPYTFMSTSPIFIRINTGNSEHDAKYYIPPYTDTLIHAYEHTSRKQTKFTSSSLLTKLDGLDGINVVSMNTNISQDRNVLPAVVDLNISNTKSLSEDPVKFQDIFMLKDESTGTFLNDSALENVDLSNTMVVTDNTSYSYLVDLGGFNRIKNIDISNSNVTSLVMPNSILQTFKVNNSSIRTLVLESQPLLTTLNVNGCLKLSSVSINGCNGFENLAFSGLPVLGSIIISNCYGLKTLTIKNDNALNKVEVINCPNLQSVVIDNCGGLNTNLEITLPVNSLKTLSLLNLNTEQPVKLTYSDIEDCENLTKLTVENCYYLPGFKYNNDPIETYIKPGESEEYPVFNISPFVNLNGDTSKITNNVRMRYLRVKSSNGNREKYFKIKGNTIENSDNIVRIFGDINIIGNHTFEIKQNFYLNDENSYSATNVDMSTSDIEYISDDPYFTNVIVTTNDLTYAFTGTNININDVYYIMKQCSDVVYLTYAFSANNVATTIAKPLDKNVFKFCSNVEDINGIFSDSSICGFLDDDLLINLTRITEFKYVFPKDKNDLPRYGILGGNAKTISGRTYDGEFFKPGNIITRIEGFNPVAIPSIEYATNPECYNDPYQSYFFSRSLVKNLGFVEKIISSFCECAIDFTRGNSSERKLLRNCPYLKLIADSFKNICGYTICNSTGVNGLDENNIPYISDVFGARNGLEYISNSFSFGNRGFISVVYIGDDFLSNIAPSIKQISNCYTVSTERISTGSTSNNVFLYGENFKKLIYKSHCKNISGQTGQIDSFPYGIISGCSNLIECCGLLCNLMDETDNNVIYNLPGNTFANNSNLLNVSHFFSEMRLNYQLMPNSFVNNKINIFDGIFNDYFNSETNVRYGKQGMIPYHLFYQRQGNRIISMNLALGNSTSPDMVPYSCNEEIFNTYFTALTSDGLIKFEDNLYDGTESNFVTNYLNRTLTFSGETYPGRTFASAITDIAAMYQFIDDNPESAIPSEYDFYTDEDNQPRFARVSEVYARIVDPTKLIEFIRSADFYSDGDVIDMSSRLNYFCPPDIFAYCNDTDYTEVNETFSITPTRYRLDGKIIGPRGRIPEMIFRPLTRIKKLNGIFTNLKLLFPYTFGRTFNEGGETRYETGVRYYPQLLSYCKNLKSVNSLFNGNIVWGLSIIPSDLFNSNTGLTYMNDLFGYVEFYYVSGLTEKQLPGDLCYSLPFLSEINGMFQKAKNMVIDSTFFSKTRNKNIINVSSFMSAATIAEQSSVPEFWTWGTVTSFSECYYQLDPEYISNYSSIPESYK